MTSGGFEIRVDLTLMVLHARVWGTWKSGEGAAYVRDFTAAVRKLAASGKPWCVLADAREFTAQSPETQDAVLATMRVAQNNGMRKAANLVAAAVTRMQVERLTKTAENHFGFFVDEESALAWLAKP